MLDGQGGDETLAGYVTTTRAYRFADLAAGGNVRTLVHEVGAAGAGARGTARHC